MSETGDRRGWCSFGPVIVAGSAGGGMAMTVTAGCRAHTVCQCLASAGGDPNVGSKISHRWPKEKRVVQVVYRKVPSRSALMVLPSRRLLH